MLVVTHNFLSFYPMYQQFSNGVGTQLIAAITSIYWLSRMEYSDKEILTSKAGSSSINKGRSWPQEWIAYTTTPTTPGTSGVLKAMRQVKLTAVRISHSVLIQAKVHQTHSTLNPLSNVGLLHSPLPKKKCLIQNLSNETKIKQSPGMNHAPPGALSRAKVENPSH